MEKLSIGWNMLLTKNISGKHEGRKQRDAALIFIGLVRLGLPGLKLVRFPTLSPLTLAALPSMSLSPFAPFQISLEISAVTISSVRALRSHRRFSRFAPLARARACGRICR